jgi:transcriptional regulator with XRE-family HTH domain
VPNPTRNVIPTFPARLRELREARGLDRAALAKLAGTSEHSIAKLEIGARSPSLELAARIARALKCKVDDLLQPAKKNSKKFAD